LLRGESAIGSGQLFPSKIPRRSTDRANGLCPAGLKNQRRPCWWTLGDRWDNQSDVEDRQGHGAVLTGKRRWRCRWANAKAINLIDTSTQAKRDRRRPKAALRARGGESRRHACTSKRPKPDRQTVCAISFWGRVFTAIAAGDDLGAGPALGIRAALLVGFAIPRRSCCALPFWRSWGYPSEHRHVRADPRRGHDWSRRDHCCCGIRDARQQQGEGRWPPMLEAAKRRCSGRSSLLRRNGRYVPFLPMLFWPAYRVNLGMLPVTLNLCAIPPAWLVR